jgi:CheY-like chemotaxis protein
MEAVGQLAGGIAHDFNNVLAGILGYAELLEPVVADQPRPRKHALAIIGAAKRAATLTGQLLAFSRKGKRHAAPLDVHHAATAACDLLRIGLDPRIVLDVHLEARHATIIGDAGMIQNMVLNLGLNARDAMHEGGTLTISTEDVSLPADHSVLCATGLPGGSYLHVVVSDTGCGMSEAVQARAFEPFFTTKPLGRGTGLGLPSVYGTVRDHGGIVTITSAVGVGTIIHVYLPVNDMDSAESSCVQGVKRSARPARVLVADDEAMLRDLLADFLGERGIEVVQAADGEEAVARVVHDGLPFDLIILDMMMPRLDGRGALNAIHAHAPQVPVLMCSGHIDDTLVDDLKAEGLTAFIAKPFTCDQLVAAIEGTLATNSAVS